MNPTEQQIRLEVCQLIAEYVEAQNQGRWSAWLEFFSSDAYYEITTAEALSRGDTVRVLFLPTREAICDRIKAVEHVNYSPKRRIRRIVGVPSVTRAKEDRTLLAASAGIVTVTESAEPARIFVSGEWQFGLWRSEAGELRVYFARVVLDDAALPSYIAHPL
jgi:3-phenylpropionate/cinnamic acid dioxygenase small subunit